MSEGNLIPNALRATPVPRRVVRGARALLAMPACAIAACGEPAAMANPGWRAPQVIEVAGERVVHNTSARERLLLRAGLPRRPQFLFSGVMAAARDAVGTQAVLAPSGSRLLLFDAEGRYRRAVGQAALDQAIAVTPGADGWTVVDRDGSVLRLDSTGRATPLFEAPFRLGVLASFGGGYVAARSPFAVTLNLEARGSPLMLQVARGGQFVAGLDTVRSLESPLLTTMFNAGHVAASDSAVFFAPLARDELRSYDARGRLRWVADRNLPWAHRAPYLMEAPGGFRLIYDQVNLAIAVRGPLVWVLSFADTAEQNVRLDAFDAETGVLERTATFQSDPTLIALDGRGAVWVAALDTLDALARPAALAELPPVRLPTIAGDTFDLAAARGKVVLLNFWASWCEPCREEFPLMNQLARDFAARPFAVVAVNEDVDEAAARRFLGEFPSEFAVPLGRGAMRDRIGYRGLPYTVLLDAQGRVVKRFFGFAGASQYRMLRAAIEEELSKG